MPELVESHHWLQQSMSADSPTRMFRLQQYIGLKNYTLLHKYIQTLSQNLPVLLASITLYFIKNGLSATNAFSFDLAVVE